MQISLLHSMGWYLQRWLLYYNIVTMLVILYNFHHLTSHSAQVLLHSMLSMKYYLECVYTLRRAKFPAFQVE